MAQLSLFEQYFKKRGEFGNLELTLKRIDNALKAIQFTHNHTQIIHVAGTNGKGSASAFMSNLLLREGHTTLLFTSPHIMDVRERIQYNNQPVSAVLFDSLFHEAKQHIIREDLSFFESIFLMAMLLNKEAQPDFLVLETGLGGRYDATNTNTISNKIPVITTIGQDHKNLLGHKIRDILHEKLAIVGRNNPVFIGYNQNFIVNMIKETLPSHDLRYVNLEKLPEAEKIYPSPFCYNYLNAHQVTEYVLQKPLALEKFSLLPCRHEVIGRVVLDGAHNISGLINLLQSFKKMPECAVVSATSDRDLGRFCNILAKKINHIILTTIPDNHRSYRTSHLKKLNLPVMEDPCSALENALQKHSGQVLITGSLYLCAFLRKYLLRKEGAEHA